MKLFQYDKKVWDDGDTDHTWQFGIINNRSLLWVSYESPGRIIQSSDGVNILLSRKQNVNSGVNILFSFFCSSLFSIDIQQRRFCLAVGFFTEYLKGWDT